MIFNTSQIGSLPYPVWICDPTEARIMDCNDAAGAFLNMPRVDILALTPADLGLTERDGIARIGPPGEARWEADLRRADIVWDGRSARSVSAFFRPPPSPGGQGDSPVSRLAQIKSLMAHVGCLTFETDAETGIFTLSPELLTLLGLPDDGRRITIADVQAMIHPDDLKRYFDARKQSGETGEIVDFPLRIVRPSGETRHIKVTAGTDLASGTRRFGFMQDVTDSMLSAERENRSQALIGVATELAQLGAWRRDMASEEVEVTSGIQRIFAMRGGPFDLPTFLNCFDADGQADLLLARARVHGERRQIGAEYVITALDGVKKTVRIMQRPVIAPDGKVTAVVGVVQDISEAVAMRHEAEAQALRLRNMVENLPAAFFLLDRDLRFTYANAEAMKIVTLSQGPDPQWLGTTLQEVFPLVASQLLEPVKQVLKDSKAFTALVDVPALQKVRRVDVYATPDGIGMHHRDVTEEIRAQRALYQSEERYRLALRASQDVVYDWNIAEDNLTWSDAGMTHFGYDPKVFPRRLADWVSILHPGDSERMMATAATIQEPDEHGLLTSRYRILRADGSTAHVLDRSIALPGPDGRPSRMIGTVTDVTNLREEAQRLRAIVDVAADTIYEYDLTRHTIFYSDGLRSTFGHDWVGVQKVPSPWASIIHPDDREAVVDDFLAFCAGDGMRWRAEYRMARADGSYAIVRERSVALRGEGGNLLRVVGILEDVTQLRRAEESAKQMERIETIGQLTGGVAHDFNNLLTIVLGNADLLASDNRLPEDRRKLADVIITAAERGAELTAGLLAFAGRRPRAPNTLDIAKSFGEVQRLLERTLPANIALKVIIPPYLWLVEADPGRLNAAILNLAVNARHAMPGGGTLSIECGKVRLDQAYAEATPDAPAGDFLRISVTDTGTGMTPEVAAKVFEPFFTTKPRGSGTGMGLSMVHAFILQSGGHVDIRTAPGQGTTVNLYLPRSGAEIADAIAETPITDFAGKGEHVLVVDDNPLLLAHVSDLISGMGYRVSAATDGAMAMAILKVTKDLDLLFTDLVLPGELNGRELATLARSAQPGLQVLFTSGYSESATNKDGRPDPGIELLAKPYRRKELARRFREMIEKTKPSFRSGSAV